MAALPILIEDLKAINVKDTQKSFAACFWSLQGMVETSHQPVEHSLIHRLGQRITGIHSLKTIYKQV